MYRNCLINKIIALYKINKRYFIKLGINHKLEIESGMDIDIYSTFYGNNDVFLEVKFNTNTGLISFDPESIVIKKNGTLCRLYVFSDITPKFIKYSPLRSLYRNDIIFIEGISRYKLELLKRLIDFV